MKAVWDTEENRSKVIPKLIAAQNAPEQKKKVSETTKVRWEDPSYRQNHIDKRVGKKLRSRTDDEKNANKQIQDALWSTPEHQKKMSDAHLVSDKSMSASKKNIRKTHTVEAREKAKETLRLKRETDPEFNAAYLQTMKERARLGAMKRWHPELLVV